MIYMTSKHPILKLACPQAILFLSSCHVNGMQTTFNKLQTMCKLDLYQSKYKSNAILAQSLH